jgi:hypothetical protein
VRNKIPAISRKPYKLCQLVQHHLLNKWIGHFVTDYLPGPFRPPLEGRGARCLVCSWMRKISKYLQNVNLRLSKFQHELAD